MPIGDPRIFIFHSHTHDGSFYYSICMIVLLSYRVPTSSRNHGKPGKSIKKSSMRGKIMEFEKTE